MEDSYAQGIWRNSNKWNDLEEPPGAFRHLGGDVRAGQAAYAETGGLLRQPFQGGGIGLIISGYTFVRQDRKGLPGQMGIQTDAFVAEMMTLTTAVHEHGGKICMQLVHAGGQTGAETIGCRPVAPSAVAVAQFPETPAKLSSKDIAELVALFVAGAKRARE